MHSSMRRISRRSPDGVGYASNKPTNAGRREVELAGDSADRDYCRSSFCARITDATKRAEKNDLQGLLTDRGM